MSRSHVKSFFAVHEAVVLTGFSKYMLDYLKREQIFAPSGRRARGKGIRRQYTYSDVVLLRALKLICVGKGRIRNLKKSLAVFRDQFGPLQPGARLDNLLLVQGNELCAKEGSSGALQELRTGQLAFPFVIDMAEVTNEIADSVLVEPGTDQFRLTPAAARRAEAERQRIWAPIRERRQGNG